jgi:hypothetical protein
MMTYFKMSMLAIVIAIVGLTASPAQAATHHWNPAGAVSYADYWSCNYGSCPNPAYPELKSDCANFMSQAMLAGGFHQAAAWYPGGHAFTYVSSLYQYLVFSPGPLGNVSAQY